MTGWGEARAETNGTEIRVEIKSVNNRHLDMNIRLPKKFIAAEDSIRQLITKRVSRGKIDVFVTIDESNSTKGVPAVNYSIARAYTEIAASLSRELDIPNDLGVVQLMGMPDIFMPEKEDDEYISEITDTILNTAHAAVMSFDESRQREGKRLLDDIEQRCFEIETLAAEVEIRLPGIIQDYRSRLQGKIEELLEDKSVDEFRLLTEVALYADRIDTNEETVRLKSHISEMRNTLNKDEPAGHRLSFLIQELNREANTIGSKSNDITAVKCVIDMKTAIEKLREQSANIE